MRPVYVTYANKGYIEFALNLCKNFVSRMEDDILLFYCLDSEIFNTLSSMNFTNIKCINVDCKEIQSNFLTYGTAEYNKLTHIKIIILKHALEQYNFIHFVDCDVAFLKRPSEKFYSDFEENDIVYQVDSSPEDGDTYIWVCTGNMTLRNTNNTQLFLNRLLDFIYTIGQSKNDQECLFEMLKNDGIKYVTDTKNIKMNVYPHDQLVNGWFYKRDGFNENTVNFHANYVIGSESKIELLKKAGLWFNS